MSYMKTLYQKWTKSLTGERRKGSRGGSVTGSEQSDTDALSTQSQPGSRGQSGDSKLLGKAGSREAPRPASRGNSRASIDNRTRAPSKMSDASSAGDATPIGGGAALQKQNAFWSQREGDSSSSTFSSNFSCSIEGKPSMDSVLRPKLQPDAAAGKGSKAGMASSLATLEAVMQQNLKFGPRADSGAHSDEWRDSVQPLGAAQRASVDRRRSASMEQHRRPSMEQGKRASMDSQGSAGDESTSTRSRRSSFALERASFDANRSSLEVFGARQASSASLASLELAQGLTGQEEAAALGVLCERAGVPDSLRPRYEALSNVPPDTPLPMTMLRRLWGLPSDTDAEATANLLESKGVMRVACLFDGTAWALVMPEHLYALGAVRAASAEAAHGALLAAYQAGHECFAAVPDDGYIMQNVGHHLVGAGQLPGLKQLLASPSWLERKMHSYGTASVVADFRRYLMAAGDEEVKLLLEAFQMSVSACLTQPQSRVLRAEMLGRLLSVPLSRSLQEWLAREEGGEAAKEANTGGGAVCLRTRTASLEQAGGLQRMTLRGHTGGVSKVLLTPGGIDVITVSADATARVWDMEIGDCVLCLAGHSGAISNVAAAADGSLLVTTSGDGSARVWELEKGECQAVLLGHSAAVNAAALDAQGRTAVTASADGTGRVWDLGSGRCLHVLSGHERSSAGVWAVALTPDGRTAVTAGEDFTARVWDVCSGRCAHVLLGHSGWVVDVAITPDCASAITASHDGTARLWDLAGGSCVLELVGHTGRLNAVRMGPDGGTALTVSDDYTARVWDLSSGACLHVLKGHAGWLTDGAISTSGAQAITASGDELAVVWDMAQGSCLNVLEGHSGEVRSVVLTRRGRFAVTGSADGTARVWDLFAGSTHAQRAHNGRVSGLVVHGHTVVTYGNDGALVWEAATGACVSALQGHDAGMRWAHLAADGATLVTASADRMIKKWSLGGAACLNTLPGHQGSRVKSFSTSADGSVGVVVLFDSSIAVWDLNSMEVRCMLQKRGERDATRVHSGGVNAALVTPDGRRAVTLSKDCTARVWDLAAGACTDVLVGHSDGLETASLSADGDTLLTVAFDRSARVWDLRSGKCAAVLVPSGQVVRCAMSAKGDRAATATDDHRVQFWELPSGQLCHNVTGHADEITGLAFWPGSDLVASCSRDCSLKVWQMSTGTAVAFFIADTGLTCCAFAGASTDKADTVVAGSESGVMHFLELPP